MSPQGCTNTRHWEPAWAIEQGLTQVVLTSGGGVSVYRALDAPGWGILSVCEERCGCTWMLQELQLCVLPLLGALVTCSEHFLLHLPWLLSLLEDPLGWLGGFAVCSHVSAECECGVKLSAGRIHFRAVCSRCCLEMSLIHFCFSLSEWKITCSLPSIGLWRTSHCSLAVFC